MDASSGGSDELPPSANDGEQQVTRQENGGNERQDTATNAASGAAGEPNHSAVSPESSASVPSHAAPSTTDAALPTSDLLPPLLPFPLPLPPAAALGGLFRDLPAPTQFFTPPPPIQIIGGAGGDGALPDRSVVGNQASSAPSNAATSSSAPQPSSGQSRAQEPPSRDPPAQLENRQDTIRRLLQTAIERTSPNPAMQVGAGANNDGTAATPAPDVQYFAIFPQPNGQSLIFMPNVHHGIGGAGSPAANDPHASAHDGASRATAPEAQQPANAGAAESTAASQAGPSQQPPNDSTAPTPEMRARQRAVRDINAPGRAAMGPAARPRSPGWTASIPSAEQRASRLPRPASTGPAQTPAGDNAGVEPPGPGFTFHFDLGNFMHLAPPQANAPGAADIGTAPSPTPQAPAGAPSGIPLGAPIMTDVVFFGPGAPPPHMMPLGPAVVGSGPNEQQAPGANARRPIPAGGVPMPRPMSLEMLMQLMGGWGGRQHLAPDPERAQELLQGLKDPGLDLLMRLDRVLCAENGGSANGLKGEGWKCAICMEGRDDADAKPAGGQALSSPMERSSTAGSAEDVEMSDVERMLSGELSRPSSFKGTGLKAFPCHHIFHETCIEPWLQSKTTCPTCRFDIDPLSTTLRLPASMQRTNPLRPAPVRPATGDARQTPYGARPMTPQGAAAHTAQQGAAAAAAGLNVQQTGRRFGMFGPSIRYTAPRHAMRDPERGLPPGYVPAQEPQQDRPPTPAGPSWPPPPATYGEDGFSMPEARREASWRRSERPLFPPGGAAYLNYLAGGTPAVDPPPDWRQMANPTTTTGNEASQTSASSYEVPRAAPAAAPQTTAAEPNIPASENDGAPSAPLSPGQRGPPSHLPEAAAATDAPTTAPRNNASNPSPGSAPQPPAPPAPQPAAGQGPLQSLTFTFEGGMMPPAFANAIFTSIMNGGAPVPVQGLVPGGGNPTDNNNNVAGDGGGPSPAAAAASPAAANPNASGQPAAAGPAPPSSPPPRVRGPKPWIIPPHKETLQEWVAGREKALHWRCDDPVCVFAPPEHFHETNGDGDAGEPDGEWQTWQPPAAEASGLVAIRAMEELHPQSSSDGDADAAAPAEQSARQRRCPHTYHPQCLKISCLSSNWWLEDPDAHGEKIWLRCPRCRKQGWVTAEDMRSQAAEPAHGVASRPVAQTEDDAMAA